MATSGISFSGLASGIDGDAIIQATIDAKRLTYAPMQNQITESEKQNKALELLNTKLLGLSDGLKDFLTLSGNGITKAGTSSDADEVGISVSSAAPATSTTISVEKLATSGTLSFGDRFSSADTPIAPSLVGTEKLTVTIGLGDSQKVFEIDIDSNTTLKEVVDKLSNAGEGVFSATAVNLGTEASPEFALVIKSNETGVSKGSIAVGVGAGLSSAGILGNTTVEQAQDAEFTIAGIGKVKRPTNKISGIIPGVTFELKQANNIPVQLTVTDDRDKTTDKFGKIISLINELVTFSKTQSKITSEKDSKGRTTNSYGDLGKTRNDDEAVTLIKSAITDAYSADGTDVHLFADLGITTQRDGTLSFDKDKFLEGLAKDPLGSAQILNSVGDKLAATDGVIAQYTRFQGIIENSKSSNDDKAKLLQDRIDTIELSIEKQTQSMKLLFAGLEEKISKLNSASTSLLSLTQKSK
jgi:flagellar hook-associated protein 2